jgi:hypothetical protein
MIISYFQKLYLINQISKELNRSEQKLSSLPIRYNIQHIFISKKNKVIDSKELRLFFMNNNPTER